MNIDTCIGSIGVFYIVILHNENLYVRHHMNGFSAFVAPFLSCAI